MDEVGGRLSAEALTGFAAYDRNLRWAKANSPALDSYEGKFVAVEDEKVIASGPTSEAVRELVRGHASAYITFVFYRGIAWIL